MYKILIRGYKCAPYIDKCMHSILRQKVTDWEVLILLDTATEEDKKAAEAYVCDKVMVSINPERMGVAYNIYNGIHMMCPEDEDVIVIVDADDWLRDDALKVVDKAYRKKKCLATYGSFNFSVKLTKSRICKQYPQAVKVRSYKWHGTHLKTFKFKVFKHVPEDYFKWKKEWLIAASDLALMFPVMELAGNSNCYHIKEPIYYYRTTYEHSVRRETQKRAEKRVRSMKPLKRLFG